MIITFSMGCVAVVGLCMVAISIATTIWSIRGLFKK